LVAPCEFSCTGIEQFHPQTLKTRGFSGSATFEKMGMEGIKGM